MRFPGDRWWLGSNATWPLAELIVTDQRGVLRLRSSLLRRLLGRWFPTIEFDGASAEVDAAPFGVGIRIQPTVGRSAIFWTTDVDRVLRALADEDDRG